MPTCQIVKAFLKANARYAASTNSGRRCAAAPAAPPPLHPSLRFPTATTVKNMPRLRETNMKK
jgi:hypothetical protein